MNCSLVIEGISAKGEPKFAYASSAILRGDLVDRGLNLDLKPENRDGAGKNRNQEDRW